MNGLSIEDKARRYDEALKEAAIAHKDEDKHLKATLERIFPELKESEDERIRKALIEEMKEANVRYFENVSNEQFLAWLEKQKVTASNEDIEKMRNAAIQACQYMIDNFENSTKQYEDAIAWLEKQGNLMKALQISNARIGELIEKNYYLKEQLEKQGEQNIAWSEENKDYYDAIIAKLEVMQEDAALTDNQMNFLKSLRPQNRWKPSEEIMKGLNEIINKLAISPVIHEHGYLYDLMVNLRKKLKG